MRIRQKNKPKIKENFGFFDESETEKSRIKTNKQDSAGGNTTENPDVREERAKSILVCDDDLILRDALIDSIRKTIGITVLAAANGKEALDVLKNHEKTNISLVITDLKMPEMNGLEFIRELRKSNQTMPVIFYSGYAQMEDLKEFMNLGAYAFLPKPFKKDLMILEINKALNESEIRSCINKLVELNFSTYIKLAHWSSRMKNFDKKSSDLEKEVLVNLKKMQSITATIANKKYKFQ